jgi:hypothetical protein
MLLNSTSKTGSILKGGYLTMIKVILSGLDREDVIQLLLDKDCTYEAAIYIADNRTSDVIWLR